MDKCKMCKRVISDKESDTFGGYCARCENELCNCGKEVEEDEC